MECYEAYAPMIKKLAYGFSRNQETREDLYQEAMLKLLKITKSQPPNQEWQSEDWRRKIHVVIRNCMIDCVRKLTREGKRTVSVAPSEKSQPKNQSTIEYQTFPSPESNQFQELAAKFATQELKRFLPELERRVLEEIVSPSEDYIWFVRKKRAIQNINRREFHSKFRNHHSNIDLTVAEYLGLEEDRFLDAISTIRSAAIEHNLLNTDSRIVE